MYSRHLKNPAEELEEARKLLAERYEKRRDRLVNEHEQSIEQRLDKAVAEAQKIVGDPPGLTPPGHTPARPTPEFVREAKRREYQQEHERKLLGLQREYESERTALDALESARGAESLTAAQLARAAMAALERPAERDPSRTPAREFTKQERAARPFDKERLDIEAEAAKDDPAARQIRAALAQRTLTPEQVELRTKALDDLERQRRARELERDQEREL